MTPTAVDELLHLVRTRRTHYRLTKSSPFHHDSIEHVIKGALVYTPSSFNSQSTRVIVLFGAHHDRFWDVATAILKSKMPSNRWEPTSQKMAMFKDATGTILFFEDQDVSDAMVQYTIWLALDAEGLGVNLQHYNLKVDAKVMDEWNFPAGWKLNDQMVFGGKTGTLPEKDFVPLEERCKVFGV
ncbi:nitroreductase [Plectosphaerella plurivora]|uniref:Nitroreductase n=1 Tax=Plectosphaerella plurivora TaxID=936078 RepID=A0A9P8VJ34_9PEZI|nr:nitroreductase [Plectosphaerella plurivora]